MSSQAKAIFQYTVITAITGGLIWFSLQGLQGQDGENKWEYLAKTWRNADKTWLLLMAFISIVSHVIRAQRWKMLLVPVGQKTTLGHSFLSVMVGYLVNLVIPRGGEVSRCYNLYKLDRIPVEVSFGTVILERIVDLLCLVVLIGLSFAVESQKLFAFIQSLPITTGGQGSKLVMLLYAVGVLFVLGVIFYVVIKKNRKLRDVLEKAWKGFKGGLLSVFKLKQKGLFIGYSISIWFLYFLMSYTVTQAFPSTGNLGFEAVLSLFAIGAIAMAAPLPGGTGSYHVLVPQGLVFLYNVPKSDAVAFTFIFHGWQTAILIIGGAISLIITSILVKKKSRPD